MVFSKEGRNGAPSFNSDLGLKEKQRWIRHTARYQGTRFTISNDTRQNVVRAPQNEVTATVKQ